MTDVIVSAEAVQEVQPLGVPDAWPLRVDADGAPRTGPVLAQDVAGPCCFAGDVVAHARELPELREGDYVVLYDTGAYYFSTPWAYNSLPRPAVHGFRMATDAGRGTGPGTAQDASSVRFAPVRDAQLPDSIAEESGPAVADALLGLAS
jgi:diaminopimelate decarboxylase